MDKKVESLESLCKEPFLKKIKEFFDFNKKETNYSNFMISKDSHITSQFDLNYAHVERLSHLGLKDRNRGKKPNEIISREDVIKMREEEEENDSKEESDNKESKNDSEENNESNSINEENEENISMESENPDDE